MIVIIGYFLFVVISGLAVGCILKWGTDKKDSGSDS